MKIAQHKLVNIVKYENSAISNSATLKATTLNRGTLLV